MKQKLTLGSLYFGVFPSDSITKATKNVNVQFLFTLVVPVNYEYSSEFEERFEATKNICTVVLRQLHLRNLSLLSLPL